MKWLLSVLAGLAIGASAGAEDVGPDVMVKNVTNEVIEIVRRDKDIQSGNTRKAVDLVETKVLPHFNFQRMTAQAVGKSWRQATADQKKMLAEEFRTLLVRTYANALTAYKNQTVDFKPLKMGKWLAVYEEYALPVQLKRAVPQLPLARARWVLRRARAPSAESLRQAAQS